MRLYIVRHAKAVEPDGSVPDAFRHLTQRGRARFREIAGAALDAGMRVDRIVTSPLVRAVQTADLLAEGLGFDGEIEADPALAGPLPETGLRALLARRPRSEAVALVGHNPHLSELVCGILGYGGDFCMKKGAVVALRIGGRHRWPDAEFLWMIADGRKSSLDGT